MSLSPRPIRPQVLLIEDEPAIAGSMTTFLRTRGGFDIVVASDPTTAQGLLSAQRWDVVIVDQILGRGPTGDMIIRAAARRDPTLPQRTIFMTGDISEATEHRIQQCGCYELLVKPFPLARILEVAREILDRDVEAGGAGQEARMA